MYYSATSTQGIQVKLLQFLFMLSVNSVNYINSR